MSEILKRFPVDQAIMELGKFMQEPIYMPEAITKREPVNTASIYVRGRHNNKTIGIVCHEPDHQLIKPHRLEDALNRTSKQDKQRGVVLINPIDFNRFLEENKKAAKQKENNNYFFVDPEKVHFYANRSYVISNLMKVQRILKDNKRTISEYIGLLEEGREKFVKRFDEKIYQEVERAFKACETLSPFYGGDRSFLDHISAKDIRKIDYIRFSMPVLPNMEKPAMSFLRTEGNLLEAHPDLSKTYFSGKGGQGIDPFGLMGELRELGQMTEGDLTIEDSNEEGINMLEKAGGEVIKSRGEKKAKT